MSNEISPIIPDEFIVKPLQSSSSYIVDARFEEVSPSTSASTYSFNTNSRLEFLINSSSEFLDFANSYLRFDLENVVLLNNESDETTKSLATGGGHSLFNEIRIESSNGAVLSRIPRYNKWYAMMSQSYPQDWVETLGGYHGDSLGNATVLHIGKDTAVSSSRKVYANVATSSSIKVCLQPALPLLTMSQYFPLSFIRGGLKIVLVLERPEFVLQSSSGIDESLNSAAYSISNPKWVCRFVQPSNDIMDKYISSFNNEGISYSFKGYNHFFNQIAAGNSSLNSFQMNANVRSADSVFTIIQTAPHETISLIDEVKQLNTCSVDSIGEFLKTNLSSYQYYSGATRFPLSRPVDMTDVSNSEALQHYLTAVNKQGTFSHSIRCDPEDWMELRSVGGETDSSKLILASKLSRHSDEYSGLDLSLIPLTLELGFDASYSRNDFEQVRYIHTWVCSTNTLTISSDGVFVRV
jgi:hypothetical protein